MFRPATLGAFVVAIQMAATPVWAASAFPSSGSFTESGSESTLNFGKRYIGFPDEECSFNSPKRLSANSWRITTKCTTADPPKTRNSTAKLEKRGNRWRLSRGGFVMTFK
jgi:hypothetical protein